MVLLHSSQNRTQQDKDTRINGGECVGLAFCLLICWSIFFFFSWHCGDSTLFPILNVPVSWPQSALASTVVTTRAIVMATAPRRIATRVLGRVLFRCTARRVLDDLVKATARQKARRFGRRRRGVVRKPVHATAVSVPSSFSSSIVVVVGVPAVIVLAAAAVVVVAAAASPAAVVAAAVSVPVVWAAAPAIVLIILRRPSVTRT